MDHIGYGTMKYIRQYHHLFLIHAQTRCFPWHFQSGAGCAWWTTVLAVDTCFNGGNLSQSPVVLYKQDTWENRGLWVKLAFVCIEKYGSLDNMLSLSFKLGVVICRCDRQHYYAQQYGVMHLFFTVWYKTTDIDYPFNVSKFIWLRMYINLHEGFLNVVSTL